MLRSHRGVCLLVLLALLLSACQPIMPEQATGESPAAQPVGVPHRPRDDAPPFALRGPYSVGVRDFMIEGKEGERSIPVSVWYPALNPQGLPEEIIYELTYNNPNLPDYTIAGTALRDAVPDPSGGPYPLIVYSHGYWSNRWWSVWLTEHLASHGFVVIAGDHNDNFAYAFGPSQVDSYVHRPMEVRRQIDYAADLNSGAGPLAGLIDAEQVGVVGHSFGADTALLAGGARLNTGHFLNEWCVAHPGDPEDWANDCVAMPVMVEKMATLAGLDEAPQGVWPDMGDPRVAAVVPLAAGPHYFGPEGLAELDAPVLLVESELDWANSEANAFYDPYSLLPAESKTHAFFERADHGLSVNACSATPALVEMGFGWFCEDAVWDMNRAQDLLNHFVTAFFDAELKGDAEAAAALAPESVDFRGVQYESTEFAAPPAAAPAALDPALVDEINAYVEETMAENAVPGLALAVVKDGKLALAEGFGVMNLESGEAVTPQTLFLGAEIAFLPTTLAILKLAEEGKLDLDAAVVSYLPYFKMLLTFKNEGNSDDITIRQLIGHTSGIPDSGDAMADWENITPALDEGATEAWVKSLAERHLNFEPGTGWEYSDIGFAVLGDVIAKVAGMPYEQYMQETFFAPLGMEKSTFLLPEADEALLASPHVADDASGRRPGAVYPYHRPFAGANNLITSAEEMAKLAEALVAGGEMGETKLLTQESIDAMLVPNLKTPFGDFLLGTRTPSRLMDSYGYGVFVGDIEGHPIYDVMGNEHGFTNQMVLYPEGKAAVIVLGNGEVLDAYYSANIAADVMAMVMAAADAP